MVTEFTPLNHCIQITRDYVMKNYAHTPQDTPPMNKPKITPFSPAPLPRKFKPRTAPVLTKRPK
jgi:hypothetical protein